MAKSCVTGRPSRKSGLSRSIDFTFNPSSSRDWRTGTGEGHWALSNTRSQAHPVKASGSGSMPKTPGQVAIEA